ncbi:MAG: TIGR01777 family oxidoreductase [Bacteroidota bacterium]|nr:TIGR01777 family oxidoreductase [Bacteroidota bacterium]
MKVLITGATGLIGSQIIEDCIKSNISVNFLTTSRRKIIKSDMVNGYYWNPSKKVIDLDCFIDIDTIIALSGSSIFSLWTRKRKKEIISSRVLSLEFLKESIENNDIKISQLISASGISLYPDSLKIKYDENESTFDDSFLSNVIMKWETAANSFSTIGVKVSIVRIGLVLSKKAGVLKQTIMPMKFGFGIIFGSGNQIQSWIHINDLSRIFLFIMQKKIEGNYNAVSNNNLTNLEFTRTISSNYSRAIFNIKIPKIFFSLIFGEMHEILFKSHNISSRKIQNLGFRFKFENLDYAVKNLIG